MYVDCGIGDFETSFKTLVYHPTKTSTCVNLSLYPDVDSYGWNALACQDLICLVMGHTYVAPNLEESVNLLVFDDYELSKLCARTFDLM